jgi:cytochrome c oxidase assembly protein subunit 15
MTAASLALNPAAGRTVRAVPLWLLGIAALIFIMIVVGGLTRLTDSGLSIVEWKLAVGWIPPLSPEAWQKEFDAYKLFPEYQKINHGMTLAEFQRIYWFEYWHRVLGRVIGLAFAIPLAVFLWRRQVERRLAPRLVGIFLLIVAQGALGWWMVQSGLVDRPDVSHFRLTAHLGLAVLLLLLCLQTALNLLAPRTSRANIVASVVLALAFVQMLLGGLVAGLDAGLIYNTWPDMNGEFAPAAIFHLSPLWLNLFEQPDMLQFQHRIGAYVVTLAVLWLWWRERSRPLAHAALTAVAVQVALGIFTLLHHVPVALAALHQAGAVVLLALLLMLRHATRAA